MKTNKTYCKDRRDRRIKAMSLVDVLETSGNEVEVHYSKAGTVELTGIYWNDGSEESVHFFINDINEK